MVVVEMSSDRYDDAPEISRMIMVESDGKSSDSPRPNKMKSITSIEHGRERPQDPLYQTQLPLSSVLQRSSMMSIICARS